MQRGFTLIEILVVVAIVALLAVVGLASTSASRQRTNLDNAKTLVIGALEEARSRAISGYVAVPGGLFNHGVSVDVDKITTVSQDIATNAVSYDTPTLLPNGVKLDFSCSPSCPPDGIIFTRLTGKTNLTNPANITLILETLTLTTSLVIKVNPDGTIVTP